MDNEIDCKTFGQTVVATFKRLTHHESSSGQRGEDLSIYVPSRCSGKDAGCRSWATAACPLFATK